MRVATSFVGRARELALLRAQLERVAAGHSGVLLLAGEPGIGKTRIAEELAVDSREDGLLVLWGRCHEGEGAPAFWPWVQVLRGYLSGDAIPTLTGELGTRAAALGELVPELRDHLGGSPAPPALEPAQARFRLFDSIVAALGVAARDRPVLVVLDDLHWSDEPSLLLLTFLAGELRGERLLIVGSYRDTELGREHPLRRTLVDLERVADLERITLGGLSADAVGELITLATGKELPDATVAAIHGRTAGNPFYVREVVRLLAAEGGLELMRGGEQARLEMPPELRDVLVRRVAHLSPAAAALMNDAAVLGRESALRELAAMAGVEPAQALDALEEAVAAGLLAEVPDVTHRYRFVHALVREALYAELGPAARVEAHARAGETLEALLGDDVEPRLAELAHHFAEAAPRGDVARAVRYARLAAERALRLLAYEQAAEQYRLALAVLALDGRADDRERCELLLQLGEAHARAGDTPVAREAFAEAAGVARRLGSAASLGRAALGFAGTVVVARGSSDPATIALLDEALAELGEPRDALGARLLSRLAMELVWAPERQSERERLSARAVALARRLGDPRGLGEALVARHYAIWTADTAAERLGLAREIVTLADGRGDVELALRGRRWLIVDLLEHGDVAGVDREIAACAGQAEELRQPLYHWVAETFHAIRSLFAGDLANVEPHAEAALHAGRRALGPLADVYYASELIALRREQDRLEEAETTAARTAAHFPALVIFDSYRAELLAELGEHARAREAVERLTRDGAAALPRDALWLGAVAALAEACSLLGAAEPAAALYALAEPHGEQIVVPGALPCVGSAQRTLGLLAAAAGERERAVAHLRDALDVNERLGARSWLAWAQHDLARVLADGGERERALELNDAALAAARRVGLNRLGRHALALEARLRRERPAGLSRREVEVLALLAAGRSNKEIAAALVVTVNTVERHLVSIYRKVGARRRADAAVFAHRHGIVAAKDSGFP